MTKTEKQTQFQELWVKSDSNDYGKSPAGTLQAATGFGKTRIALNVIRDMNERNPDFTTLIIVPTRHLKNQWEEQVSERKLNNVIVGVINTYCKQINQTDLLVLDEIHNYAAPEFYNLLKHSHYNFILGLTATIERHDDNHYMLERHAPIVMNITLEECRRNGWVSEFKVYNVKLKLGDVDKEMYRSMDKKYHYHFSIFEHNFDVAMKCLMNGPFRKNYASRMGYSPTDIGMHAAQWNRLMHARKQFIYSAPSKIQAVRELILKFPDKKVITFSQSIDFADQLTEELGDVAVSYHSNMETRMIDGKKFGKTRLKRLALKKFQDNRYKVRVINTAKALDEGFDVEDIDMAIVASSTSSKRQNIQRTGRAVRYVEDKVAVIVNLYLPNTRDESWLKSRQTRDVKPIYTDDLNDITFDPAQRENSKHEKRFQLF